MTGDNTAKTALDLKAEEVLASAFKNLEDQTGNTITPERREKFTKALLPSLKELDEEYLTKEADTISRELANSLQSNQTFFSRVSSAVVALFGKVATAIGFTKELTVSTKDLTKIAKTFSEEHKPKSNKFSENKLEDTLSRSPLSRDQLASALSTFLTDNKAYDINTLLGNQQGKLITTTGDLKIVVNSIVESHLTNSDLAKIRNINPKGFDETLAQAAAKTSTKPVVDPETIKEIERISRNKDVEEQRQQEAVDRPKPKTREEIQKEYRELRKDQLERW